MSVLRTPRALARLAALTLASAATIAAIAPATASATSEEHQGGRHAVYVMTNDPSGNAIEVFTRSSSGALDPAEPVPTGGSGTGAGLGSQGALVLSDDEQWLFAANAGSDSITSFRVTSHGLERVGTYGSQGIRPTSVTVRGGLLYVLNAGGSGSIAGFSVKRGALTPLVGSVRPLSSATAGGAQVQFDARGQALVVTERTTNRIVTYPLTDGIAGAPVLNPSVGAVPFGFDIDRRNHVIVSEAQGAAQGTGVSSYQLGRDLHLTPISQSVANGQGAACWLVISEDGRFAYTANAATNNLSSYTVAPDGSLTLLQADVSTDMQPLDMDLSNNGRFLYVIDGRSDTIRAFEIGNDGRLTDIGVRMPVVTTAVGMAAS